LYSTGNETISSFQGASGVQDLSTLQIYESGGDTHSTAIQISHAHAKSGEDYHSTQDEKRLTTDTRSSQFITSVGEN
jgi:hypothetical protein